MDVLDDLHGGDEVELMRRVELFGRGEEVLESIVVPELWVLALVLECGFDAHL